MMNTDEVLIPFAIEIDDDTLKERLCSPDKANKLSRYECPECREPLILKRGKVRKSHFAHDTDCACNPESLIHKTAKMLIRKAVHEWRSDKSRYPITIKRKCQYCFSSVEQALPEKFDGAILEYRLPDGSIADVALMVGGIAQAAVEIYVTHAVDEIKARRLSVPFIELNGNEVIENSIENSIENPTVWKPITDGFKPLTCCKCKSNYSEFQTKIQKIAKESNIELPTEYYRYWFDKCWNCNSEIIIFGWPGKKEFDKTEPKFKPIPKTVQYCRLERVLPDKWVNTHLKNKIAVMCWINTCPYCSADCFEQEQQFQMSDQDSSAGFSRDMMEIINRTIV